ncbi:MAG: PEGA domain-containing protein [Polyangiaceae bacterium]
MSVSSTSLLLLRAHRPFALRLIPAIVLGLTLALSAHAANDANGDDPQLEAPIQQGIALRRAGNDEAALNLFVDLERTNPDSIRVLLHITAAAQATGRWMMAYTYLRKAYTHQSEPYFQRYRAAIKTIEDATTQHIGQFRAVGAPAGAQVRLNGELVGSVPMPNPKPVEVGQYVLEVSNPGFYTLRRSISVGPGTGLTQESVELRAQNASSDAVDAHGKLIAGGSSRELELKPWWHARWVTWTLAGATAATAATSAISLVYRNDRADRWNGAGCLDGTKTRQEVCGGIRDNITLGQNVAIGSGIAAVVFGGLTLTQAILSTERTPVASASKRELSCVPGLASFACLGTF